MTESIDPDEAVMRARIAAQSYAQWPTEELWEELGLVTDESWDGRSSEQGPEQTAWAKREAIGLALIDRGAKAAEVETGLTPDRFKNDRRRRDGSLA